MFDGIFLVEVPPGQDVRSASSGTTITILVNGEQKAIRVKSHFRAGAANNRFPHLVLEEGWWGAFDHTVAALTKFPYPFHAKKRVEVEDCLAGEIERRRQAGLPGEGESADHA
ncbi:MAG: hypothetical protein M1383_00900 [Patescibacteria group bacterium]|nr:hypothetical protein [Patescibacteria group bacterium]